VKHNCNVAMLQDGNKWGGIAIMLQIHILKVLRSNLHHNTDYSEGFSFFSLVPPNTSFIYHPLFYLATDIIIKISSKKIQDGQPKLLKTAMWSCNLATL
jgi:hypothetical protein